MTIERERSSTVQRTSDSSIQPCTLVIFGGSGDLTRRKLFPAVYNLILDGLLPENYAVVGIGRKPWSHEDFRHVAKESIEKFSRQAFQQGPWEELAPRLHYVRGSIDDSALYRELRGRIEDVEAQFNVPSHRIFYLAIPPTSFATACQGLQQAELIVPPDRADRASRVIVENPSVMTWRRHKP